MPFQFDPDDIDVTTIPNMNVINPRSPQPMACNKWARTAGSRLQLSFDTHEQKKQRRKWAVEVDSKKKKFLLYPNQGNISLYPPSKKKRRMR
jgi:hypothetical protein